MKSCNVTNIYYNYKRQKIIPYEKKAKYKCMRPETLQENMKTRF